MHEIRLDGYDLAILDALQQDGSLTNAALGEIVHLSASQSSRRRAALENSGLIRGYGARLDAQRLGLGLRAIIRVNLRNAAFSVSGDADYVLDIRVRDLEAFAAFMHQDLLPHPQVAQVRSEIVLKTLKDGEVLDLRG